MLFSDKKELALGGLIRMSLFEDSLVASFVVSDISGSFSGAENESDFGS